MLVNTILIVDDVAENRKLLATIITKHTNYAIRLASDGEAVLQAIEKDLPDLILLDIMMPGMDGYAVSQALKSNPVTQHIPIIFLTEKRERIDRLQGFEVGADDYITKPFDVQELRLRVRNALKRVSQGSLTNPVSGLPEGPLVEERLSEAIHKSGWALLHICINHLDSFRESYGFVASDDVLRAISLMIHNTMKETGSAEDFIGHLSPTDFVVVVLPANLAPFQDRIRSRLEQSLDYFYPIKDREQASKRPDRLSIQISEVPSVYGRFSSVDQLKKDLLTKY